MESRLQARIIKYLDKKGFYTLKVIRCNKAGHPDITAYGRNGRKQRTIFIEVKDEGEKADPLQAVRHEQLTALGFEVYVVDSWIDLRKNL